MKDIQKLCAALDRLENRLAADVAEFAAMLDPFPDARDSDQLGNAWSAVVSSRRKLWFFLRDFANDINAVEDTGRGTRRAVQTARQAINAAEKRLRYWGRFEAVMLDQIRAVECELLPERVAPDREMDVMDHVVTMFLDAMHKVANPNAHSQGEDANARGLHRDIPLPMIQFTKMIAAARRLCLAQRKDRPLRFLDVGSGGGTKVLAATTCFDICHGMEYEESTVVSGSRFLKLLAPDTCRLIHADALTFSDYADYDAIYFYRPLVQHDDTVAMEARILSQVPPGTVLMVAGELLSSDLPAQGVHRLADHIYVTGMSRSEAIALHKRAAIMGTMVPGYGRRSLSGLGYWQVLLEASARNGYHI